MTIIAIYKSIFGFVEIVLGLILAIGAFFTHILFVNTFIQTLIQNELTEDPQDFLANLFISHNIAFGTKSILQVASFIIILGIIKLLIAYAVWFRSKIVRNISMYILSFIGIIGIYAIIIKFSIFKLIGLSIDIFILYYFWKIFPKYLPEETTDENKMPQQ